MTLQEALTAAIARLRAAGVPDPAVAAPPDWPTAFQTAYDTLSRRAEALLALPLADMDGATLRKELDDIGKLS